MLKMRVAMRGHLEDVTLTDRGVWKGGSRRTREGLELIAPADFTPSFPDWELASAMKVIERFPYSRITAIVYAPGDDDAPPGRIY